VVVDAPATNADLARDAKLDYPILSDPGLHTADAYGVRHTGGGPDAQDIARPASVLVDGAGIVRWTSVTRNFRVRPTPADVLAAIDAFHLRIDSSPSSSLHAHTHVRRRRRLLC